MIDNIGDYDECIKYIKKCRSLGKDWEVIRSTDISSYAEMMEFPLDYKEKWNELVDWFKDVEEKPEKTMDYIYSDDINNNITIPNNSGDAWYSFRENVLMNYGIETAEAYENSAKKILDRLKLESKGQDAGKGLVMGYVQSGKTMNIESVITMGADIGFNIFIMLSGTIENLRKQGLERLRKDIQYKESTNIHWNFLDLIDKNINIEGILTNSNARIVAVCLKNSSRLTTLKEWLINYTSVAAKDKMKILLIDDEADQASLNTKRMDFEQEDQERTKINKLIMDIVNCNDFKAMNYISYTATPYGNFLNEKSEKSLYPKNFIISLPKSGQYIGAIEIFGDRDATDEDLLDEKAEGLNIKNHITDKDIDDFEEGVMPASLQEAICWFICTVAIRRFQGEKKPVSMLIHTDSKTLQHQKMNDLVIDWIKNSKKFLLSNCRDTYEKQKSMLSKESFLNIMQDYNGSTIREYPSFEEIKPFIEEMLYNEEVSHILISDEGKLKFHKGIHVVIDNSNNNRGFDEKGDFVRLAYPNNPQFASAIIVIGGNTLARGLTLDGLTTSYFARKVSQVDTLMQMGRWFGYRIGYELLPRIWITEDTEEKFREIAFIEKRLREELGNYDLGVKPSDYAPKVYRSYLTRFLLTSRNKSQGASRVATIYEKVKSQTVVFEDDENVQRENLKIMLDFMKKLFEQYDQTINDKDENYLWRNIPFKFICDDLLLKMRFYHNDRFFSNIKDFVEWMNKTKEDVKWDIIIENSDNKYNGVYNTVEINNKGIRKVNRGKRKRTDVIDLGVLRNPKDETNAFYYENGKMGELTEVKRPKLFLYIVDGQSKVKERANSNMIELNLNTDIAGIFMYVPNMDKRDKDRTIVSL